MSRFAWMEYETQFMGHHLRIRRRDGGPTLLSWDDLQAIKNEIVGGEACLIEIFPPESMVVNEVNVRHLWVVPTSALEQLDCFLKPTNMDPR